MSDGQKTIMQPARDQLTVVETVYHLASGEEPTAAEVRFVRELETVEQPYVRKLVIGEEWQPLDFGWVKDIGMFVLRNDEGAGLQTMPTDEERAAIMAKVLELGTAAWDNCRWLIFPQDAFRATPKVIEGLVVRCLSGKAKATIYVYPR